MPRTPSEHAVWLGCTGMVLVVLESMLKLVITSKCAISGFRVYLPLKTASIAGRAVGGGGVAWYLGVKVFRICT